jgi:hypothetical protein
MAMTSLDVRTLARAGLAAWIMAGMTPSSTRRGRASRYISARVLSVILWRKARPGGEYDVTVTRADGTRYALWRSQWSGTSRIAVQRLGR